MPVEKRYHDVRAEDIVDHDRPHEHLKKVFGTLGGVHEDVGDINSGAMQAIDPSQGRPRGTKDEGPRARRISKKLDNQGVDEANYPESQRTMPRK